MQTTFTLVLTFLALFVPALGLFVLGLSRQAVAAPAIYRRR
jgi:hypothetical protein